MPLRRDRRTDEMLDALSVLSSRYRSNALTSDCNGHDIQTKGNGSVMGMVPVDIQLGPCGSSLHLSIAEMMRLLELC